MENPNPQEENSKVEPGLERNETPAPSLEEVENKISTLMNHNDVTASDKFREELKARVLEAHAKNNMPSFAGFKNFLELFTVRRLSVAVSVILLVAVVGGVLLTNFLGNKDRGFARIFINPAYAADDFSLVPLASDSTGVTPDSAYKLTSKEAFGTSAIKAGLTVSPAVEVEVTQTADQEWVIKPQEQLPANSILRIALAAAVNDNGTVVSRDFSWAFQVKDHFRVLNSLPGNASANVPVKTGIEVTFSHPNLKDYQNYFSISPAVKGQFEYHARTAVFVPAEPLAYGALYTVTVAGGLGLTGSEETLGSDYKFSFEVVPEPKPADRYVWFGVNDRMVQFSPDSFPYLEVYGDKTMQTTVSVYSFVSADAFIAGLKERDQYPRWTVKWSDYKFDVKKLTLATSFSPKIETKDYQSYISFPSKLPAGFYLVEVAYKDQTIQVLLQVNDLNMLTTFDAGRALVWVNTQGGGAVANALIEAGELVQNVRTGQDGTAVIEIPKEYQDPKGKYADLPVYMVVRSGDSTAVDNFSTGYTAGPSYWSYFYTDRPRYQADDKISFWAMTRDRATNAPSPGQYSVVLRKSGWYDYFYNPMKIAEVKAAPDAYGTMTGEILLKGLKPDTYEVALMLDGETVMTRWIEVLPYVKPAYSISITSDKSAAYAGDQIKLTAKAEFFDGTPAVGLKLNVFAGWSGEAMSSYTTDDQGQFVFTATHEYRDATLTNSINWPQYDTYTVRPESSELGEISGSIGLTWYGPAVYATSEVAYPEKGKAKLDIKVRKIDINKINAASNGWSEDWQGTEPAAGTMITGEVRKIWYEEVETGTAYDFINKLSYKTHRYDRHSDLVDTLSLMTGADGIARYSRTVEPKTFYEVHYSLADSAGRKVLGYDSFYYYDGYTYYRDYFGQNGEPTIEFNKADRLYSLNDEVKATLAKDGQALPAAANNRFLFAKYQNGLKSWTVQDKSVYAFNFAPSDIPNVQLFAAWWNGKDYHTARTDGWWGSSDGGAKYDYTDRELTISAAFDKAAYAPGDDAKVNITVKDKEGRPVKAAVNLNLVDEAYYAVANDQANPLPVIYSTLYSGIIYSVTTHMPAELGETAGLGAERGGCFAAGTLVTMADGKTKPIEKIKVGDQVATLANPLNPRIVAGTVSATFTHPSNKLISVNKGMLKATPEHMIYASGTFMTAGELKVGDVLVGLNGKKTAVTSLEIVFERSLVYNLTVDPYHTYIANGVYVHNDKDGAPRQKFVDVALFRTVETDGSGRATVDFKMPDNVTTWRLTTQAIGADLTAGVTITKAKATLPAFVNVTVGDEYLTGDQVIAKLRSFGKNLNSTDSVTYKVTSPGLNNFSATVEGKAFAASDVALPPLTEGKYDVTYSMSSAKGNDAVLLPVTAVKSYLRMNKVVDTVDVVPGAVFSAPGADGQVTVTFSDESSARLYRLLSGLSWSWGKRVDQQLAKAISSELLVKYFEEDREAFKFDANLYAQGDGGIALLPYGSSDMDLSARLAALAPERFDKNSLGQYFFRELESANATPETVTDALLGLASLGEPVLPRLQLWKERTDLSVDSRMRLSLAFYKVGAYEEARAIYNDVLKQAEERGAYYLLAGVDEQQTLARTSFLAELAAALNMPERDKLWAYATDRRKDSYGEFLMSLEQLVYTINTIPTLTPGPSKVDYKLNGAEGTIDLTHGWWWGGRTLTIPVDQLGGLEIIAVEGKAKAIVSANMPLTQADMPPSKDVSVSRTYSPFAADSKPANEYKDGDLVRVKLDVTISRNTPDDHFLVTDILPAGLVSTTEVYNSYGGQWGYGYWSSPFEIDGQRVSFHVYKYGQPDSFGNYHVYIQYYARVRTKGTYKAEAAIVQGFKDPNTINYSTEGTVIVK